MLVRVMQAPPAVHKHQTLRYRIKPSRDPWIRLIDRRQHRERPSGGPRWSLLRSMTAAALVGCTGHVPWVSLPVGAWQGFLHDQGGRQLQLEQ